MCVNGYGAVVEEIKTKKKTGAVKETEMAAKMLAGILTGAGILAGVVIFMWAEILVGVVISEVAEILGCNKYYFFTF